MNKSPATNALDGTNPLSTAWSSRRSAMPSTLMACDRSCPTPHVRPLEGAQDFRAQRSCRRSRRLRVLVTATTSARAVPQWNIPITTADGVQLRLELVAEGLDKPTDLAF